MVYLQPNTYQKILRVNRLWMRRCTMWYYHCGSNLLYSVFRLCWLPISILRKRNLHWDGICSTKRVNHLTKRKPKYLFYWKENFSYQNGLIFISWSFLILMFSIAKIKDNVQFSIFIKWHIILQMNYGSSCIQLLNSVYMTKNCQATVDWRGQFSTF